MRLSLDHTIYNDGAVLDVSGHSDQDEITLRTIALGERAAIALDFTKVTELRDALDAWLTWRRTG